jgi:hypothetical protein
MVGLRARVTQICCQYRFQPRSVGLPEKILASPILVGQHENMSHMCRAAHSTAQIYGADVIYIPNLWGSLLCVLDLLGSLYTLVHIYWACNECALNVLVPPKSVGLAHLPALGLVGVAGLATTLCP